MNAQTVLTWLKVLGILAIVGILFWAISTVIGGVDKFSQSLTNFFTGQKEAPPGTLSNLSGIQFINPPNKDTLDSLTTEPTSKWWNPFSWNWGL